MPVTCIVMNCGSRFDRDSVLSFFRIPTIKNSIHHPHINELSKKRRDMWLAAIKRRDLTPSILRNQRVCSLHFITGKPSTLNDENNPDWVPSQLMGHDCNEYQVHLKHKSDVDRKERADKRRKLTDETSDETLVPQKVLRQTVRMSSKTIHENLWDNDPELFAIIKCEKQRQLRGLEMIASENFTSMAVLQCLSSCLTNKYSEGLPAARYYGGNQFIDKVEVLAQKRSLQTYKLNEEEWGINVQPYSGSPANFAVYTGIVEPHGRIMGLDLPDGGHLTHGFFTATKKISATSIFFESLPYKVNPETGLIDYDALLKTARLFKPKIIIAGISCYSRALDYKKFREICDDVGAYLMSDMAHISGLVAAGVTPSPFEHSDIVTTTTHKSLRGPRAGIIFFRKGCRVNAKGDKVMYDFENKINQAVFPGLQGGPHENAIAAIATTMKQASTPEFKVYAQQVITNAKRLSEQLQKKGYKVVTGGTDVHLLLVDLRSAGITGAKGEYILEEISIACNKNTVPGDKSAMNPSGIRLGTPALTTRGFTEKDIDLVVEIMDKGLKLAKEISGKSGPKLVDFKNAVHSDEFKKRVQTLREEVEAFSEKFPMPGYECY